jgi:RimJ/RimL family protein N-acetyltransferase
MSDSRLTAPHLQLVAGTVALLEADLSGREALARELEAHVPATWPPELYDRPAMEMTRNYLHQHPDAVGWGLWYLLQPSTAGSTPTVVGICGFKGKPSEDGTVEIGYSVLGRYQKSGFASEAVAALVSWAFGKPEVKVVIAETLPHLRPSIRVMEKNGFHFIGRGSEDGVIRYELRRIDWEHR